MFQFALLWVVSDVSQAIPIFNLLGGGGGGGSQKPKCRYVPQTAYFPTYDTVYKQECSTHYENQCTTEVISQSNQLSTCYISHFSTRQNMRRDMSSSAALNMKLR